MSRLQTDKIDYTSRDYDGFRELLIEELKKKMPEYTDIRESDAGIVILEALANGLDIMSLYLDVVANDVILPTTYDRKMAVLISKCLGYEPYNQTTSTYPQVFVLNEKKDRDYVIPKGTRLKTADDNDVDTLYFEVVEDFTIPANCLGNEQDEEGNYLYTAKVCQGETINQDIIGSSSGAPLQSFKMNYTNVLIDTIELYVNEGQGFKLWNRVDNFLESTEESRVYTANVDEFDVCTIEFGNGFKGKIPISYPSGISATYRIGGGSATNVSANTIVEIDTSSLDVESTFNLEAIVLGHDKESLDSIKENAPASFRARNRLVTLQDYEDLLRINFYDFFDIVAERDFVDKRLAHIHYIMKPNYTMKPELVEDITRFITERSMIGTLFELHEHKPQVINLVGKLYVDRYFDPEKVKEEVISYITNTIFSFDKRKFGRSIIKSDIEMEVKNSINGVLSLRLNSPVEDIIVPTKVYNVLELGTIDIDSSIL